MAVRSLQPDSLDRLHALTAGTLGTARSRAPIPSSRAESDSKKNPHEMSVAQTIEVLLLARASDERLIITPAEVRRLQDTAPPWPSGHDTFRSLRLRWGDEDEGVRLTFEIHLAQIARVFTPRRTHRSELLRSDPCLYQGEMVDRLRLLNQSRRHVPTVEWVIVNLDAHRRRTSVTAVRRQDALADEALAVAWLFPERIRAINYNEVPGFYAAGYEVNCPEHRTETWAHTVCIGFTRALGEVRLGIVGCANGSPDCSIPIYLPGSVK